MTQPKLAVRKLLVEGPCMPADNATKQEILEHCRKQYKMLEEIQEWLILYCTEVVTSGREEANLIESSDTFTTHRGYRD